MERSTRTSIIDAATLEKTYQNALNKALSNFIADANDDLTRLVEKQADLLQKNAATEDAYKAKLEATRAARTAKIERAYQEKLLAARSESDKTAAEEQHKAALKNLDLQRKTEEKNYKGQLTKRQQLTKKQRADEYTERLKQTERLYGKHSAEYESAKTDAEAAQKDYKNSLSATDKFTEALKSASSALLSFDKKITSLVSDIAKGKTTVDTARQGSRNSTLMGSYYDKIIQTATEVVGASPFVSQKSYVENITSRIQSGINFNVEQRAFLATISDQIAATFNANDGTLRELIRIQQQDTTAARLGMESSLTAFLNNRYETSEYMKEQANQVKSALSQAEKLMGGRSATEFEYQVQKWLGSLYSVGFDSTQSLANIVGSLASGDISALTGSTGPLAVMAANRAGLSIASVLQKGLDSSETNQLLEAMVQYRSDLYDQSKDNLVVQQQIAKIYGLSAADLKAAANLNSQKSLTTVANTNLTYSGRIDRLQTMANSIYQRTSTGERLENVKDNFLYSMAGGIANNPITYVTYAIANRLGDVTGGINIPDISIMGNAVSLGTTVANIMKVAALSGGLLNGIGTIITGMANDGGFGVANRLKSLGISNQSISSVSRGSGQTVASASGASYSESGFVGNTSGDDVYQKTLTDVNNSKKSTMAEAKEEEQADLSRNDLNDSILKIYNLLNDVVSGVRSLSTRSTLDYSGVGGR